MKVRLKFSKTGALVYIGHLDVMRYFQKLFRRAMIPVRYSEGFSPHQILSFTPPLPLGLESYGEYADVELTESITSKDALSRLRAESVPEIEILSFKQLPEKAESAMASVRAAGYSVHLPDAEAMRDIEKMCTDLLLSDEVCVLKKTKKSERMINIRPLIYKLDHDIRNSRLDMTISSGSTDNIKPELVLDALFGSCGRKDAAPSDCVISRTDQFTKVEDKLVSLDEIGSDITNI